MHSAAILGTEQMICAGSGRAEPHGRITAGDHVHFDAECGHVEAVNHILRGHDQLSVASYGNVEFIDLALAFGVLQLPHPLLGHDIDFRSIAWWSAHFEEEHRAPDEHHQEDTHREH